MSNHHRRPIPPVSSEVTTYFTQNVAKFGSAEYPLKAEFLAEPDTRRHTPAIQALFVSLCPKVETLLFHGRHPFRKDQGSTLFFPLFAEGSLSALHSLEVRLNDRSMSEVLTTVQEAQLLKTGLGP